MSAKCVTYISYLPTVENGNVQSAGTSKWILTHNQYGNSRNGWTPVDESFYGYVGQHYEYWVDIINGDEIVFRTSTSGSPIFDCLTWRNGNWWAWVTTGHCGRGHWTKLVADPEKAEYKSAQYCDNGLGCPGAEL